MYEGICHQLTEDPRDPGKVIVERPHTVTAGALGGNWSWRMIF